MVIDCAVTVVDSLSRMLGSLGIVSTTSRGE